ncbi:hypothetical protein HOY82DRAFT_606578 [Tuber indicum]|nr:hypothetical protein HOY82DRAFT_606578 [Tuber indicum]
MTGNTSRVPRVQPSSSSSLVSFTEGSRPAQDGRRPVDSFVKEEELTDVDEDDIAVRPRRAEKRLAEPPVQQKSTEDSPSPAPNGPSEGLSSPRQGAQLHSGHLRVDSSHISPYNGTGQQTMPSNSGRRMVNQDFLASDIAVPVTISLKSNTLHGEERILFVNTADMVQYHTWFVNPFEKPAENDVLLESYFVKAATKLGWRDMQMGKAAMTLSSARSHLVSESKNTVEDLYDFAHKPPNEIKARVSYLLENDRFTCHPNKQEVINKYSDQPQCDVKGLPRQECGFWFAAPEIAKLLFHKWYRGSQMRGRSDKTFLKRMNDVLIYLTTACMYHALKASSSGSFVQYPDFWALTPQNVYLRQRVTWQGLSPEVRKMLVDDTKKRIKKMLREGGFIQDQESRAALEDKEAAAYMELEIPGDEESEAEDVNSDPEGGDDVEALEEGWDEDE